MFVADSGTVSRFNQSDHRGCYCSGYMWDYVFDWTILKYQQQNRAASASGDPAGGVPRDARRTTGEESGASGQHGTNSMGVPFGDHRSRPQRYTARPPAGLN
jgi:hypothetical protein